MDGVKIGEMKRDVVALKDVWVPYNVPAVYRTRIVYTVTIAGYNAKGHCFEPELIWLKKNSDTFKSPDFCRGTFC
jgi:hypothetical protein